MKNKMTDVRDLMISAMEQLVNPDSSLPENEQMTWEKAGKVAELGKVLVESVKAEVMYVKVLQSNEAASDFVGQLERGNPNKVSDAQVQKAVNKALDSNT